MMYKKSIGILGGSFDPPHAGHTAVAQVALDSVGIDEVWFLLSLRNPFKDHGHSFQYRLNHLKQFLQPNKNMLVCGVEHNYAENHTVRVLKKLTDDFPDTRFVWMMGVDELASIDQWDQWESLFQNYTILLFHRPKYMKYLKELRTYPGMAQLEIPLQEMKQHHLLSLEPLQGWVYIHEPHNFLSSSFIKSHSK